MNKTPLLLLLAFLITLAAFGQAPQSRQSKPTTPKVTIEVKGNYRYITSNGLPDHATGRFPTRGNPNAISPQSYQYRVPVSPEVNEEFRLLGRMPFGVAINGVNIDPSTAEWWKDDRSTGWHIEGISGGVGHLGMDSSNAHVQPTGAYHYHGIPNALHDRLAKNATKPVLVGWAADGFPIYGPVGYSDAMDASSEVKELQSSWQLRSGDRPSEPQGPGGKYDGTYEQDFEFVEGSGDLDQANGRFGVTAEYPKGTYYYVMTETFPFIPRFLRGTPDESCERRQHGQRGGGHREGRPRGRGSDPGNGRRPPR